MHKKIIFIKSLGAFFMLTGLLELILDRKEIYWNFRGLIHGNEFIGKPGDYFLFHGLSGIFFVLILAAIVAGYGLMKLKKLSWALSVAGCTVLFFSALYGIISVAVLTAQRTVPMPNVLPNGAVVQYVWPTYLVALISLALIILLSRKSIREIFKYQKNNA